MPLPHIKQNNKVIFFSNLVKIPWKSSNGGQNTLKSTMFLKTGPPEV